MTKFFQSVSRGAAFAVLAILGFFWDAVLLAGCSVFVYGVWRAWAPGAYMVAGVLLVAVAFLFGARKVPTISTEARQ